MPAYVITKAIWDAVQKTAVANDHVSGLLSDASYVVVDCDTDSEFRTLPAEVIPTITITKAPSEAGLDGLVAGMTAAEVLAAWTGRPLATVSNGKDPHYAHAVRIDGAQVTDLTATANLTIATTVSAAGAEDVVTLTDAVSVSALPTVAELSPVTVRNAANPNKIDVTYTKAVGAGHTASAYIGANPNGDPAFLTDLSKDVTFTSKGSYPLKTYVWVYIKDKAAAIVDSALIAILAAVDADPVIPVDPVEHGDLTPSMTHDGVTAFFAASHPTGIYADGSPWVSSGGNAISITGISPASASGVSRTKSDGGTTGPTIVNGAMLDPGKAPSGTTLAQRQASNDGLAKGASSQCYDSYTLTNNLAFDASGNVDPGATSKPISLAEGTILKAVSNHDNVHSQARPALAKLVPLTVVTSAPAANAFRPGHADPSKAAWLHTSDMDLAKLPNIASRGLTLPNFATTLAALRFVSWQHTYNALSRNLMPGIDGVPVYGGDRNRYAEAMLALCYDGWSASQKSQVATALVQMAIDITARVEQGGIWQENGGHCVGQKSIVALAAHLTGHQRFRDALGYTTTLFVVGGGAASIWGEDRQIFRIAQADVNRRQKYQYNYPASMIGVAEWASDATRDDPDAASNFRERLNTLGVDTSGAVEDLKQHYRHIIAGVNVPAALALHLMGGAGLMRSAWLEYQDRHMAARVAANKALPDGQHNDIASWVVAAWKQDRESALGSGGTNPDPGPVTPPVVTPPVVTPPVVTPPVVIPPVVTPPVINLDVPAIVLSIAQSEPAYTTETGSHYNRRTPPDLKAENFTMYHSQKSEDLAGPVIKTVLTQGNRGKVNHSIVALANALAYAVPGKQFVLSEAHESGTSRVSLANKGDLGNKDRRWEKTQQMVDAVLADYPQGFTRMTEFWWAADSSRMPDWLESFAPFYFGQLENGSAFKLGDRHAPVGATVDHCIYDFETSDPATKGRGLLPRTVPLDVRRKGVWGSSDTAARWAGVQKFMDDARFKALGGYYGPHGSAWIDNGGGHPNLDMPQGQFEAAYDFFMPTMLRAAGIPIGESYFRNAVFAADGTSATIEFVPANGGVLSTKKMVQGFSTTDQHLSQEIFGFELTPAAGGGMYRFARPGTSQVPQKYHANVTKLDDTHVRIVPVVPFVKGDVITFEHGFGYRSDLSNVQASVHNTDSMYKMSLPIEHVAAFTDPDADYPFSGFPTRTYSSKWVMGSAASNPTPTVPPVTTPPVTPPTTLPPVTPPIVPPVTAPTAPPVSEASFFTMKENGPYFVDPNNVPRNTTRIRHRFRVRIPTSVAESNKSQFVVTQESNGFDIRLLCRTGSTSIYIHKIEDQGGTDVTPSVQGIWSGSRDEWVDIEVYADQNTQKVGIKVNDGPVEVRAMTGATGSEFQSGRELCYFGQTSGASLLSAGVDVAFIETYLTVGGVERLHKRIAGSPATVNADPWRQGEAA